MMTGWIKGAAGLVLAGGLMLFIGDYGAIPIDNGAEIEETRYHVEPKSSIVTDETDTTSASRTDTTTTTSPSTAAPEPQVDTADVVDTKTMPANEPVKVQQQQMVPFSVEGGQNWTTAPPPKYLLGFSTGHAGSTSVHFMIGTANCTWERVARFESFRPRLEQRQIAGKDKEYQCNWVENSLIQKLSRGEGKSFVDIGHYFNLGHVMDCLAASTTIQPGELAWVHIRRSRYAIANSFSTEFDTPCHSTKLTKDYNILPNARTRRIPKSPAVSYCPHSQDHHANSHIHLPVDDEVWMSLTPFQKFLWSADELEMRYHNFKNTYPNGRYYDISWNTGFEFDTGIRQLLTELKCTPKQGKAKNTKKHVSHNKQKECKKTILEDLDYRKKVGYTPEVSNILFKYTNADSFNLKECIETREELEAILAQGL